MPKSSSSNNIVNFLLFIIIILLGILFTLFMPEGFPSSQSINNSIPLSSGSSTIQKPLDIQGNPSLSPQQPLQVRTGDLPGLNLK